MADDDQLTENEEKILETLGDSLFGMSITEIADKIEINRMTAAKYLEIMYAKGLVSNKKVGTSKLWIPRQRSINLNLKMALAIEFFQMYIFAVSAVLGKNANKMHREAGIKIGETIYDRYFPKAEHKTQEFSELINYCADAMQRMYPITSKIYANNIDATTAEVIIDPCICQGIAENKSMCEMQTGLLIGFSKKVFEGIDVDVEEKECMCDGAQFCSYLIRHSP
jgi:predicted hydrocarbon binding protein/DNA-binding CsgD family transcriptional regulator